MRQETGSNCSLVQDKISVRLPASGDLFVIEEALSSLSSGDACAESSEIIHVELLTKRMMLIPTQMLALAESVQSGVGSQTATVARQQLAIAGITHYEEEQIVSLKRDDITALVVVPKLLISELERRYGVERVSYEVPLLRGATTKGRHLFVDSYQGVTTIKSFEEGEMLRFADVYETPTVASAIYWVQRVSATLSIDRSTTLYIYRCSGTMRRILSRNFNKILVCE